MAVPHGGYGGFGGYGGPGGAGGPAGFPDDDRADVFVREFPTAVAPANRDNLMTRPPLFILRIPGDGPAYEQGVHRVVEALRAPLDERGKLVPYAHLAAGQDSTLLSGIAGLALQEAPPARMTPDRFPHFHLVRDLVTYIVEHPERWPGSRARELRDHAAAMRGERGGMMGFLRGPAGQEPPQGGGGIQDWLLRVGWLSFTQTLPRWYWARWMSRRVMRRWLAAEPVAAGGTKLFRVMDHVAAVQAVRLAHPPDDARHEAALQELDQLLVRALLEDLRVPPVGRILPRRRRRTARPVLLVELPPPGTEGARAAERFLRAYHRARVTAPPPGPLVVAVGRPSGSLLADLGDPAESNFSQAGVHLGQRDGTPVLVTLGEVALARPGLPVRQVEPRRFRTDWRTATSLVAGAAALAVAGAAVLLGPMLLPQDDHACVGGDDTVATTRAEPVQVDPKGWYDAAFEEIQWQNERAERLAAEGRTVRTVVHFGSSRPVSETETLFDGTIPELRGIALWQRKLNDDAVADRASVPLRVDVRTTGKGFVDAEGAARRLVADMAREQEGEEYEKVVGVLGFAQSRDETRAALQILGKEKIPVVGTTATADEMLDGEAGLSYWPFTPPNSTEARIAADFASGYDIVARRDGGGCSPARQAIVIESSADLYSRSLADKFRREFTGTVRVINFNQDGDFGNAPPGALSVPSATELASQLCKELTAEPDSVVYWSARAADFSAFINAMDNQGTCIHDDLTVLGGNELTNVALTGAFDRKTWLRLYYSAHRLPVTDPRASDKTRQFVEAYDAFVGSAVEDPWRQDGHSAVSYDAFHVLSQAVYRAGLRDDAVERESVLIALGGGVTFDGATGYVSYDQGSNTLPVDKTLVLLRQSAEGPLAVVVCGAYRQGETSLKTGAPCAR
ncbi:ABC transporter substrate-binding protein [Streptomyces sp. NPDC002018]|uniref:ABC transporter substrate-binding protein n=1 Tax=Streptomyces sp. NPDC002018 TaxID=3364629 RepID=UPI0036864704